MVGTTARGRKDGNPEKKDPEKGVWLASNHSKCNRLFLKEIIEPGCRSLDHVHVCSLWTYRLILVPALTTFTLHHRRGEFTISS